MSQTFSDGQGKLWKCWMNFQLEQKRFTVELIGPLPTNFPNLDIFWVRIWLIVVRKAHKKPILVIKNFFYNPHYFRFFQRFSCWKLINFHRFFLKLLVMWWGQIFISYENLHPWLPGRALEKICNCTILGGKVFSIQKGFIDFKKRNHKFLMVLKYIFQIQYIKKTLMTNYGFWFWKMKPTWI